MTIPILETAVKKSRIIVIIKDRTIDVPAESEIDFLKIALFSMSYSPFDEIYFPKISSDSLAYSEAEKANGEKSLQGMPYSKTPL